MDRFIDKAKEQFELNYGHLKSNMDRFIDL